MSAHPAEKPKTAEGAAQPPMQPFYPKVGGSLYSPPCTRSQKDRFEKRLQNEEPLVERRRSKAIVHRESGKVRPALKMMENLPDNKADHAAAGKGQATAAKAAKTAKSRLTLKTLAPPSASGASGSSSTRDGARRPKPVKNKA